ncbi:hypothetical protein N7539_004112 [Penicillium diatomitis]|uniref:Uncharacterized protein n=1 Tax=Penicillium diatomitis TaxID=2819901 RepID=A0A9X0BYI0_9EURO|nr:uncharacterized protein N7539_004112 [Penicillium diatomitis]KAJ5489222.1 hypothetical protein N7539_004112 [Penicillium diatomitis]
MMQTHGAETSVQYRGILTLLPATGCMDDDSWRADDGPWQSTFEFLRTTQLERVEKMAGQGRGDGRKVD